MDFMKLLKSVEEMLYELVTWILFYPLTLWRSLRHPLHMMQYAEKELGDNIDGQFDDALSPPVFLLITLAIAHFFELKFDVPTGGALPTFLQDDANLLFYRGVAFSLFPLLLALQDVRHRQAKLTRSTLRLPFYSQCYLAAPFVLSFDLAILIGRQGTATAVGIGYALGIAGLVWFCTAQVAWFRSSRSLGLGRATATVIGTVFLSFLALLAVLVATAFTTATIATR